jgi:hypothetical protein
LIFFEIERLDCDNQNIQSLNKHFHDLEALMVHTKPIAVLLVVLLVFGPVAAMAQTPKEKLGKIAIGKVIEVKLLEKGSKKITGKLLSDSDDSFEIQTTQSGSISNEKISFDTVKSVKKRGMRKAYKALIWTGAVMATSTLVLIGLGLDES